MMKHFHGETGIVEVQFTHIYVKGQREAFAVPIQVISIVMVSGPERK